MDKCLQPCHILKVGVDEVWIKHLEIRQVIQTYPQALIVSFDVFHNAVDQISEVKIVFHVLGDFIDGVNDCGMVSPAKLLSDFWQRQLRHFPGDEHSHLPWIGNGFGAFLQVEVVHLDVEVLGGYFFDQVNRDDFRLFCGNNVF